ncbi:Eco57I restriction-modification methylase domain-containing protein [Paenibacillus sp. FSL R10-2771]|uniref:Eco57I restriction-modification methylase domain-containing protein n=1 Tax=Paenibacillus sp. FSL R10-2771 TaxID=2954693 RepID=UPI0030F86956
MNIKKQNGVYYTPSALADFIINYLIKEYSFNNTLSVLEPSCGDGVFVESIRKSSLYTKHNLSMSLVEIDKSELSKIPDILNESLDKHEINYYHDDFLDFQKDHFKKYDFIIGNPPYIKKNFLSSNQIEICNEILQDMGIFPAKIKNIWTAFLVRSIKMVKEDGIVCFVLPAELLQVKHAEPIRELMSIFFQCIEIFTFNEIIFENIEQDTIIFIGSKKSNKRGLHYHNINSLDDIVDNNFTTIINNEFENGTDKWTSLMLDKKLNLLINNLRDRVQTINSYCKSSAGIVTAANEDFIIGEHILNKYKLNEYAVPIVKKSSYIQNSIKFTSDDLQELIRKGTPTNLIAFENDEDEFSSEVKEYLMLLKEKKIHERYKCKNRHKWFVIPSIWKSEAFFFKRSYHYPKVIINEADVCVTDTAYRITMKENFETKSFTFSFYNSLTLVFTELFGRFYGGGVLELTPNEFKKLPLPYVEVEEEEINHLDFMFRTKVELNEILEYTNFIILEKGFGFTKDEIKSLDKARELLMTRRLKIMTPHSQESQGAQ